MKNETSYILQTEDEDRTITIHPVNLHVAGVDYSTGVFNLKEGAVGLGDIVFDEDMNEWEYTGIEGLMYEEAEKIALFIKRHNNDNE